MCINAERVNHIDLCLSASNQRQVDRETINDTGSIAQNVFAIPSPPHDHFGSCPHRRVLLPL